ncbi:MAG TPA: PAS domain-containing sensor histidine kinase [Chloroflexota bacterium]|jgi:PAS domain S-box-containing protein|nr:PAS domain-containing sensor histidine kinase [Chloroflexota bacterium]
MVARRRAAQVRPEDLGIGRLFWSIHESVLVVDLAAERIVLWNPAAERLLGYTAAEALALPLETLFPERLGEQYRTRRDRFRETGQPPFEEGPVELPAVRKDGREIVVDFTLSPLGETPRPRLFLALARDVSERARLQRRREVVLGVARRCAAEADPERLLQTLLEGAVDLLEADDGGIAQWDETRNVLFQVRSFLPSTSTGVPLDMARSASGQAVLSRAPVIINEYQRVVGAATPAGRTGAQAGVAVPLLHEGRLLGTLSVSTFRADRRFGEDDAAALEMLAGIGAAVLVGLERARLEGVLRVRQELLSSISHDLRNPLSAVSGGLQMLERRLARLSAPETADLARDLARVRATAGRVWTLVDQLSDLATLESGHPLELDRRPTDLVALARSVVAELAPHLRRHTLRFETVQDELVGDWDGPRLARVLDNLLSNAVKYSPRGGEIVVTLERRDGSAAAGSGRADASAALLTVRDPGIGIPETDLPHVFDRFHRGANVAGRFAGTGLGLAGARQIVEQHGGAISVESREGIGSTFTVRLPLP